ncbi:hypothetical protein V2G26_016624 [Clonostachys chloroleuca]
MSISCQGRGKVGGGEECRGSVANCPLLYYYFRNYDTHVFYADGRELNPDNGGGMGRRKEARFDPFPGGECLYRDPASCGKQKQRPSDRPAIPGFPARNP